VGAVALAATQTNTAVIRACYAKRTGAMRRISANGHCKAGERALKWNVTGIQGPKGDPGSPGTDGTTISHRVRLQTPTDVTLTSGTPYVETPMLLTDATWTQAAAEVDQIIGGAITVTTPTSCDDGGGPYPHYPSLGVTVYVDGSQIMYADGDAPLGETHTYLLTMSGPTLTVPHTTSPDQALATLFEPGTDTGRTLAVSVHGGLSGHAFTCDVPAKVTALSLDVLTMH
jgi:hypothetical protein